MMKYLMNVWGVIVRSPNVSSWLQGVLLQGAGFGEKFGEQLAVPAEGDCVDVFAWFQLDGKGLTTSAGDVL